MPYVTDPSTGYPVWEEPAAPANPHGGQFIGSANSSGAGGTMTPTTNPGDPQLRVGKPVDGRPGYMWQRNARGEVVAVLVDQNAATGAQVQATLGGMNAPKPITDPAAPLPAPAAAPSLAQTMGVAATQGGAGAVAPTALTAQPRRAVSAPTQPQAQALSRIQLPSQPAPAQPAVNPGFQPLAGDFSGVDEEMSGLRQARADFYSELDRLSGVDPFGNQAFLQKATDRAVSQAAGTAAGARGGAAALAGANRQAVGVQAQTAARGTQEVAEAGRRDAVQAAALRNQTIQGIESVGAQLTGVEQKKVDQLTQQAEVNLRGYLGGRELDQREKDSLRNLAVEIGQIDMERYKTDVGYRQSVDNNLTARYQSDNALKGIKMQVDAGENMSASEWAMGILGMGAGLGAAAMTGGASSGAAAAPAAAASDRRAKFDVRDPDLRDLQDYLGNTRGKLYRYKEPHKPGRRSGLNFGPMAQDLQKSKIGRTLVVDDGSGTLKVDTARLALADHAALAALAAEVQKLKAGKK